MADHEISSHHPSSVHPKQPNRLAFNEKIAKIRENIRKAETDRGSLSNKVSIKIEQLKSIREVREKIKKDKSRIFDKLEVANKEVRAKVDKVRFEN